MDHKSLYADIMRRVKRGSERIVEKTETDITLDADEEFVAQEMKVTTEYIRIREYLAVCNTALG